MVSVTESDQIPQPLQTPVVAERRLGAGLVASFPACRHAQIAVFCDEGIAHRPAFSGHGNQFLALPGLPARRDRVLSRWWLRDQQAVPLGLWAIRSGWLVSVSSRSSRKMSGTRRAD